MKVLFLLTRPVEGPGERYRVLQYVPYFERHGIECTIGSLLDSSDYRILYQPGMLRKAYAVLAGSARLYRLLRTGRFDAAVIYRQTFVFWPGLLEALLEKARIPFLVDIDDAIYLPIPESVNPLASLFFSPKNLARTLAKARCVVAGNAEIAEHALKHCPRVEIIPTCVDTDYCRFQPRARPNGSSDPVVIGWMGTQSSALYLRTLERVFAEVVRRNPRTRIRVVGAKYAHPLGIVESRPWELRTENEELAGFDIGVMPTADDAWARGKCGLKLLQYLAAGMPVVASPVGVNADIVRDGTNGYLARTDDDWIEKLSALIRDPQLRRQMAAEGRRMVEERYSVARWAPRLAEIIRSLALCQ